MQDHESGETKKQPDVKAGNTGAQEISADNKESGGPDRKNLQEGRDGDALAWLEGPAFNSPIEEMPTLQWPEPVLEDVLDSVGPDAQDDQPIEKKETINPSTGRLDNNLEDAMVWLEQLALGQGTSLDEMPTLISGGQFDENSQNILKNGPDSIEITGKTSSLVDNDSDPMAWLEQLAVDQSSPLEELPSVADRLLASEIISHNESEPVSGLSVPQPVPIAIEVEEALIYLEHLAISEGIALNKVNIDQFDNGIVPEKEFDAIDQLALAVAVESELTSEKTVLKKELDEEDWDDLTNKIPDDPDEALAWLGGLADDDSSSTDELDSSRGKSLSYADEEGYSTPDANYSVVQGGKETTLDFETLNDMPDDPDEAMAWMEGLAEQEDMRAKTPDTGVYEDSFDSQDSRDPKNLRENQAIKETLESARKALSAGDIARATELYQNTLDKGKGGTQLIRELEAAVNLKPESAELIRLLGDAYMQDGQMQKALKTYRRGFDHL